MRASPSFQPLLTAKEAAEILSLSEATLSTWRSRGRVARDGKSGPRFLRLGRTIRYRQADIDEWIVSHGAPHL